MAFFAFQQCLWSAVHTPPTLTDVRLAAVVVFLCNARQVSGLPLSPESVIQGLVRPDTRRLINDLILTSRDLEALDTTQWAAISIGLSIFAIICVVTAAYLQRRPKKEDMQPPSCGTPAGGSVGIHEGYYLTIIP
ncbi:hypothetical protein FB451DRAFT_1411201 [Mycena latifolia]|nr:hypothetical protein FB451DRAFT_1411201 [Mycena latifolia]